MKNWLLNLFGITPKATPSTPQEPVIDGYFSTDNPTADRPGWAKIQIALTRSFQRNVGDTSIEASAQDSAIAMDSGIKARMSGTQIGIPEAQVYWYASQGFIGYQMCAMLAQHWLVDKACSMPGKDAVRGGYTVTIDDGTEASPELIDAFRKADKRYRIRWHLEQFSRMGRIFGVRHALFVVTSKDPEYYEKPFNPDGITAGSYKGISQVDPYWITPELDAAAAADPSSMHFYEPTYWRINGKRYHRSHLIIYRNDEVADILKPSYLYGGVPLPQKIYERVYAAERCANEGPQLLLTKRATAIHVDVAKALANSEDFDARMHEWMRYRDNFGVKVLGKDEIMEQFDTSLADVDQVIMTEYQIVAAIAEVPATKLLGTSPKGFNSTGEYEESTYHEFLEGVQAHCLEPLLARHHLMVMRSNIAPVFDIAPVTTGLEWEPLDALTTKEQAEVNKLNADTGLVLVNSGAIDGIDERARITADPTSGYTGLPIPEDLDGEEGLTDNIILDTTVELPTNG